MNAQVQVQSKVGNKSSDSAIANNAVKQHFSTQRGFSAEAHRYPVQTKLTIGHSGDKYEQEADRVADLVMRMPEPQYSECSECEEEEFIQTKPLAENITPLLQIQRMCAPYSEEYKATDIESSPVKSKNFCPKCRIERSNEEIIQTKPIAAGISVPFVQRRAEKRGKKRDKIFNKSRRRTEKGNTEKGNSDSALNFQSRINDVRSRGVRPLPASSREFFESRFGRDFSGVRVHSDVKAAGMSHALKARAFTVGQDIFFGAGEYAPETTEGQRLLAHELTHTVQQGNASVVDSSTLRTRMDVSRPGEPLEWEAGKVARHVVAGEVGVGNISKGGVGQVQRLGLPEIPSWEEVVSGAEELYEEAVETGEEALEWAEETAGEVAEAAGEAVDWLTDTAGRAALDAANSLAGLFGGSVIIRKGCLIITIPEIPLFPSFQKTLGETPPIGFFIPVIDGGTMVGPFPVAGLFGILAYAQGSIEAAVGPGVLRGIRVEVCPFRGSALATAQLYVATAIGPRLTLFGGLFGAGATIIPFDPPVPVVVIIQGGLRGTGTGWFIGARQDTVTLSYSGGRLSFSNIIDLMGGVLLQGDVDLFAALRLYDRIICQYVHPLGHWETGRAWKLTIPIHAALSGGAGTGGVGPITWGPMPIKDIETAIRPLPSGWNCLSWAEIKQILCDNGILPPSMCPPSALPPPSGRPPSTIPPGPVPPSTVPPSTVPPRIMLDPPGDCTEQRWRQLQEDVDKRCKKVSFSCKKGESCPETKSKMRRAEKCAKARETINKECFRGGDPGHKRAAKNARRAQKRCRKLIKKNCK